MTLPEISQSKFTKNDYVVIPWLFADFLQGLNYLLSALFVALSTYRAPKISRKYAMDSNRSLVVTMSFRATSPAVVTKTIQTTWMRTATVVVVMTTTTTTIQMPPDTLTSLLPLSCASRAWLLH